MAVVRVVRGRGWRAGCLVRGPRQPQVRGFTLACCGFDFDPGAARRVARDVVWVLLSDESEAVLPDQAACARCSRLLMRRISSF